MNANPVPPSADSSSLPAPGAASLWRRIGHVLEMIKVQHTVFALPFALLAALAAADGWTALFWEKVGLIVLAVLAARSAAMAFNRWADADHDAANPRTSRRHIPAGILSKTFTLGFVLASLTLFAVAAWLLCPICLYGSPIVAVVLLGYSYSKRFTWLCHLWLGASLGLAPIGAWLAIRESFAAAPGSAAAGWGFEPFPWILGLAVCLWTAGFDMLYACQDFEFDRTRPDLHSVPKRFGLQAAFWLARGAHLSAAVLLGGALWLGGFGPVAWCGLGLAAALLIYEHRLVRPQDLTRIEAAFFLVNGAISLILLAAVALEFAV